MKKWLALLLTAVFMMALVGCQTKNTSDQGKKGAVEVTDMMSRTVKLTQAPVRIVSLTPSTTEILSALGLKDKLVGVDAFSDYPEDVKSIAKVGDFNGPNIEKIIGLKPDLVVAGNKLQEKAIKQLDDLKVTTAAVESSTYKDIYRSIELVGKLTGTDAKASALIGLMKKKEAEIIAKVKDAKKPSVYYVLSYGEAGNWTSGPTSFINDILALAGGDAVTKDGGAPWMDYSMEQLIKKDPDFILVSSDVGDAEKLKKANGYKDLRAVKEGKVIVINSNLVSRPGPRIVDGLEAIAKAIHSELFK